MYLTALFFLLETKASTTPCNAIAALLPPPLPTLHAAKATTVITLSFIVASSRHTSSDPQITLMHHLSISYNAVSKNTEERLSTYHTKCNHYCSRLPRNWSRLLSPTSISCSASFTRTSTSIRVSFTRPLAFLLRCSR